MGGAVIETVDGPAEKAAQAMINAAIDRHHWAEAIADLLREMPQRCAAAVRMSYFEHLPEHEIAVRLGTSLADARKALACGLGILGRAQSATPHV